MKNHILTELKAIDCPHGFAKSSSGPGRGCQWWILCQAIGRLSFRPSTGTPKWLNGMGLDVLGQLLGDRRHSTAWWDLLAKHSTVALELIKKDGYEK
jgi:hypothetical protein